MSSANWSDLSIFCRSGAPCFPDRSEKVSDIVQNKGQARMPVNRLWVVQRDHTGNTDWPAGEAETTAADRTSFRKLSAMFAMGYSR
jgi:hypothetical protein